MRRPLQPLLAMVLIFATSLLSAADYRGSLYE